MQVLVTGGVFNRADGLAEEIRADLFAPNVRDALRLVESTPSASRSPTFPSPAGGASASVAWRTLPA